ncbi:MAG: (Fe-S)-binding protein [Sulfolobales archaeon]
MKRTGNPIGVSVDKCVEWSDGTSIPRGGESIIYTSCMYQMAPYIKRFVEQLQRIEGVSGSSVLLRLGGLVSRFIDLSSVLKTSREEIDRASRIVRNIFLLLRRYDEKIGYLYDEEPYSGALLYELGLEEAFIENAKRTVEIFRKHNVKRIYTIDPHTHHVLKHVYPLYIDNFDFEVIHYLEVVSKIDLSKKDFSGKYVIHDPCLLARYSNIIEQQRDVLRKIGVEFVEPLRSGVRTRCCGGPVESVAPSVSGAVARLRLEELSKFSDRVIVMCPICYISLSRYANEYKLEIRDLAEFLG